MCNQCGTCETCGRLAYRAEGRYCKAHMPKDGDQDTYHQCTENCNIIIYGHLARFGVNVKEIEKMHPTIQQLEGLLTGIMKLHNRSMIKQ